MWSGLLPEELRDFFDRFEAAYREWREGEWCEPVVNEEIERVYHQMPHHEPKHCKHGKTLLTCSECYFNGWSDRP